LKLIHSLKDGSGIAGRATFTGRAWIETAPGDVDQRPTLVARPSPVARGLKRYGTDVRASWRVVARPSPVARGLKHVPAASGV